MLSSLIIPQNQISILVAAVVELAPLVVRAIPAHPVAGPGDGDFPAILVDGLHPAHSPEKKGGDTVAGSSDAMTQDENRLGNEVAGQTVGASCSIGICPDIAAQGNPDISPSIDYILHRIKYHHTHPFRLGVLPVRGLQCPPPVNTCFNFIHIYFPSSALSSVFMAFLALIQSITSTSLSKPNIAAYATTKPATIIAITRYQVIVTA